MTERQLPDDTHPAGPRAASRIRTFLKGVIYYDNRHVSIECTIRDLSDTGARLAFTSSVTVPDKIELHIPQRQRTLIANVQRREPYEIGVAFEDQRSGEPRRISDTEMAERVIVLEAEVAALKRIVKKLKAEVMPHDSETM